MKREEALAVVKKNVKNRNLLKHMYAVEAVVRHMAHHFGEDEEKWALAGLLHDIDYDVTADDPAQHSQVGADMVAELGLEDEIVNAIRAHNEYHGLERKTLLDKVLYAADPLTGLIVAAALIHPDKKLASIDAEFVMKRYHEKAFARGATRETIAACADFGMELETFVAHGLEAMQGISKELGL